MNSSLIKYILILSMLAMAGISSAQRGFSGTAILGLNFSQIDGDDLYGYNKIGLEGGVRVGYFVAEKSELGLELLLSQRGSSETFTFSDDGVIYTQLNYLSVPITIDYRDWYVEEEKYYKARVHAGLAPGYLFSVSSTNGELENSIDFYNRFDLGYVVGASFYTSEHLGFTFRFYKSFLNLRSGEFNPSKFIATSYYLNFRTEYKF